MLMKKKTTTLTSASLHRTTSIADTITAVPQHPQKLSIYQLEASL